MTTPSDTVLLTVRGTLVPPNLDAARTLHNDTAGSEQGIAAARALGDLSHKVFAPCSGGAKMSSAKAGELLFIDTWTSPQGIMEFFSNAHVQQQAGRMFSGRDATVWMPAQGAFTFHLPAAMGRNDRYVGVIRAPIASPEKAIEVFRANVTKGLRDARRRGQLSHELFIKLNAPGDTSPVELLGVDVWTSLPGLLEHYGDASNMAALGSIFAGAPNASVWEQPQGHWSEW